MKSIDASTSDWQLPCYQSTCHVLYVMIRALANNISHSITKVKYFFKSKLTKAFVFYQFRNMLWYLFYIICDLFWYRLNIFWSRITLMSFSFMIIHLWIKLQHFTHTSYPTSFICTNTIDNLMGKATRWNCQ